LFWHIQSLDADRTGSFNSSMFYLKHVMFTRIKDHSEFYQHSHLDELVELILQHYRSILKLKQNHFCFSL
ncbi:unnamed protein product, partial [Rotaria sordida]